ncbi:DUF397 domain-containing protein [Actinomadura kijaniata]|uniref:DUF397 domain-containing protein n=1 Tax=Actinomadura namibiensis TaxID=182080 RepID=A0A7W3QSB3_ACTNM|nr:DUF397 domain-containing protein [Actinomadura namibiensis]MBA8957551.1 hypothetical protein [Actinomadura namibiensis]
MNTPDLSTVQWRKSSWSDNTGGQCIELGGVWRKSSYSSNTGGQCIELGSGWSKSSHSGDTGGACVELASFAPTVAVRDSKDPNGPKLLFPAAQMDAFFQQIKTGGFGA